MENVSGKVGGERASCGRRCERVTFPSRSVQLPDNPLSLCQLVSRVVFGAHVLRVGPQGTDRSYQQLS